MKKIVLLFTGVNNLFDKKNIQLSVLGFFYYFVFWNEVYRRLFLFEVTYL